MSQRSTSAPSSVCLSEYGLDRHLLGLESEQERERSLSHIAQCDACQQDIVAWREAAEASAPLPAMPPSLWDRVIQWWSQGHAPGLAFGGVAALALVAVFAWQQSLPTISPTPNGRQPLRSTLPTPAWRIKGSDKPVLMVRRTRKGQHARLTGSGIFLQGDEVRIYFKWLAGRYIFLLHRDAKGKLTPLYPSSQGSSAPIHQGGMQSLPDAFAVTDPAYGDEEIWACFSKRAIAWSKLTRALPSASPKGKGTPVRRHLPKIPPAKATTGCLWRRFLMKRKTP